MEKDIERKLRLKVESLGGECYKFVSPGRRGVPDRVVLLPGARIGFVELKDKGEKPSALQRRRRREIERLGFQVFTLDDPDQIQEVCDAITGNRGLGVF